MSQPPLQDPASHDLTRRHFVGATVAAGVAGMGGVAAAATDVPVTERDVTMRTPDGQCDAAFFHPTTGKHPGVLVWTDAFGLRASMRDIGRRLAAQGYAVLVPNPYYRIAKAPLYETAAHVDFKDPATFKKLGPLMASIGAAGAAEKDAQACVAFLDAQPQVDPSKKIGTQGYCMGGALVVRSAAALPDRIGAGASFHGGNLVTDKPDSPHLLAPKIKAHMYFGVASNDDAKDPQAKEKLAAAFAAAGNPATVERYDARHGWCVADMPMEGGTPIYDKVDAERAWSALLALYGKALD